MQQHIPLILLKKEIVRIKNKCIPCLNNQNVILKKQIRCHKVKALLVKNNDNYHDDINNHINGYKKDNNDDDHDDINNHINGYKKDNDINDNEEYWIELIYQKSEYLNVEEDDDDS